jgi:hypothetical protein
MQRESTAHHGAPSLQGDSSRVRKPASFCCKDLDNGSSSSVVYIVNIRSELSVLVGRSALNVLVEVNRSKLTTSTRPLYRAAKGPSHWSIDRLEARSY